MAFVKKGFDPSLLELTYFAHLKKNAAHLKVTLASTITSKSPSHIISICHSKLTSVKANICYEQQMFPHMQRYKMVFERKKRCR